MLERLAFDELRAPTLWADADLVLVTALLMSERLPAVDGSKVKPAPGLSKIWSGRNRCLFARCLCLAGVAGAP